ncbi:hypothetical protein Y032_0203g1829 [Ancylostoma ceylanicum]|uniref:Uncharacterized protein n=1 Tax=Ancylostoma ceylanicum TaxID=53326 RepID=A0A016SLU9_9BILA|nr:hypothetical protein Y032_0203g1829 [Ancylostoma ceylanicum]
MSHHTLLGFNFLPNLLLRRAYRTKDKSTLDPPSLADSGYNVGFRELGVAYQSNNTDAMVNLLKKSRVELERCVFENTKLRVRLNELYTRFLKEDEKTTPKTMDCKNEGRNGIII